MASLPTMIEEQRSTTADGRSVLSAVAAGLANASAGARNRAKRMANQSAWT
nr:hypothetical protein [uncultured Anaeromusa sp.]